MAYSDDEYYDDDVYYDDDDDVNDVYDDDEEVSTTSSSSTNPFSRGSSGLPGSGRSGSFGSSSSFGSRDSDSSSRSGSSTPFNRSGDSSSRSSGGFGSSSRGSDSKQSDSRRFGAGSDSSSRSSSPGRGDDSSRAGSGGRLGGLGRGGTDSKRDNKKSNAEGGGILGSITSRFGGGGGGSKKSGSGGIGGKLSGLTSRLTGGGGSKGAAKSDSGGGRLGGLGRGGSDSKPTAGGTQQRSGYGGRTSGDSGGGSRFNLGRGGEKKARAPKTDSGGSFLSRINIFNRGDDKKSTRTSKTRASKVPKKAEGGFQLDLDAKLDILGVVLVFGGLILSISSLSADQGSVTGWFNSLFVDAFGWGALAGPVAMLAIGVWLIVRHFGEEPPEIDPVRLIGVILLFLGALMIMMFIETFSDIYSLVTTREELLLYLDVSVEQGRGGGQLGAAMYKLLIENLGEIGTVFAILGWIVVGIMFATRTSAAELAIFMISVWRSFQISLQRRAQVRRAERMAKLEQRRAQEAAQISVSRPTATAIGPGTGPNALPAPEAEEPSVPIEERPIPIRMGGQMIPSSADVEAQPAEAARARTAVAEESDSSGLFGGFAARLRKATPSLPFTSSGDGAGTDGDRQEDGSSGLGAAAASAVSTVTTLGGLLGSRDGGDGAGEEPAPTPAAQQPTPSPERTAQRPPFGERQPTTTAPSPESPFRRPEQPAAQATPPAATPGARPSFQRSAPTSTPETERPAASTARPRPFAAPERTTPTTPSTAAPGGGTLQDRIAELRSRIQERDAGQDVEEEAAEEQAPSRTEDQPSAAGRMSRLEQIRAGMVHPDAQATQDGDEDEEDEDEEVVVRPASAQNPFARSAARSPFGAVDTDEDEDIEDEEDDETAATPAPSRTFGGLSPSSTFRPPSSTAGTPARVPEPEPEERGTPQPTPEPAQPAATSEPVINRPRPKPQAQPVSTATSQKQWRLPDYRSLLASGSDQEFDREGLVRRARIIEETLQSFGAPGRVVEINTGPVITQFGVEPDYLTARGGKKSRVKVSAIAALDKDLQLALGAKSIRVEAPVPGKGYVGIEVPNEEASLVSLRDVMESREFTRINSPLTIALGQSVDGSPVAADLTQMPHLLIAGTTGSGKSVCVNSIIASLLVRNTPETVKFIMVDPKRVELTGYNNIPHLVAPVVVELERIVGVLKWVTREMDERYKRFSNAGSRNIVDYNNNIPPGEQHMPYIIVIIDELADLMMLAPDETERVVTRIAALARATGIHLVIATQRPSVDVVTGLIKANFPARIAFAVAGGVDSRVILDQPGAERLLGKGDMLYMSPDSPAPLRLQGVFVSDMEISNINRFWQSQSGGSGPQKPITALVMDDTPAPQGRSVIPRGERFVQPPPSTTQGQRAFWDDTTPSNPDVHSAGYGMSDREPEDERDELYGEAVELVRRLNKASVSLLQRRLRIGYTRAARLIDIMEAEGVVGPPTEGSKPREVLPAKA